MPANLTDSNAFSGPVVAPADGDAANAASIVQGLQPLANRSYYVQQLCEVSGVKKIRCGDAAAMQAATGIANKTLWLLEGGGAFHGLFVYDSGSAFVSDNVNVFPATGMGAGRWVHCEFSKLNTNLGRVTTGPISLGGSGVSGTPADKIDPTLIIYGTVQLLFASPTVAVEHNATTSYIDIPNYTLSVPDTIAGDIIFVDMQLKVYDQVSHQGSWKGVVVDGASTNDLNGAPNVVDNSTAYTLSPGTILAAYTVVTGGTLTVKGQFKTNTGGGDVFADSAGGARIRVLHVRP